MSEAEMNSYRFNSGQDPSDEMLAQIMREVAANAKRQNEDTAKHYLDVMQEDMRKDELQWAQRINQIKNDTN